jgi:hypothetical protein
MKKILCVFLAIVLLTPLLSGAVTWQKDSDAFMFPGVSILLQNKTTAPLAGIRCVPDVKNGFVTIQYHLPPTVKNATLTIYSLSGALIQAFDLQSQNTTVKWSIAGRNVAAGIYLAAMRYGIIEHKTQISIVK